MDSVLNEHSRTIIHVDIDCFYAQVEMVKNPSLTTVPLGIQQKNIVVTSNYVAREYGIKKCMLISDAMKVCPNLVLVKGEDLHDYRQISYKITTHLQKYSSAVERLGLDENFIDVSDLIKGSSVSEIHGNVFGDTSENCGCGCEQRLKTGTKIAQDIRDSIKREFNLTCCAGIAHNKLLAKLVGSKHKPDQQTVIFPNSALELIMSLESVKKIPGIGRATADTLENIGVKSIEDLQNYDLQKLVALGIFKAKAIKDFAYGVDLSPVKSSGRPQSIGLEDSCKSISVESEIREKMLQLLNRLFVLIQEDGRVPKTIKLTVRKFDRTVKMSHRETKQCNVNPSLFASTGTLELSQGSQTKIMNVLMHLFSKMVNAKKPYHITLLGLSCTKFQEPAKNNNLLASFLRKSLEVQSVTSIENKEARLSLPLDIDSNLSSTDNSDFEPEVEPSPKKLKFSSLISRKPYFQTDDCPSPSKLNVAELRLSCSEQNLTEIEAEANICCPPDADEKVFKELPRELQKELWEDCKRQRERSNDFCGSQKKKPKLNTLFNYFVKNN